MELSAFCFRASDWAEVRPQSHNAACLVVLGTVPGSSFWTRNTTKKEKNVDRKHLFHTAGMVIACAALPGAAQPLNDTCATAEPIGHVDVKMGDNTGAIADDFERNNTTLFPGNSGCFGTDSGDVYYRLDATMTGRQRVTSCGSMNDVNVAVYESATGMCDDGIGGGPGTGLTHILFSCQSDAFSTSNGWPNACPADSDFFITFDVVAGNTYYIRVASESSAPTGMFTIQTDFFAPPANDVCETATVVTQAEVDAVYTDFLADNSGSNNDFDPNNYVCSNRSLRDIFYSFTPTVSKTYRIDSCGSGTNTNVQVFDITGIDCSMIGGGGDEIGCNNVDGFGFCTHPANGGFDQSFGNVVWSATAGNTYIIRVNHDGSTSSQAVGSFMVRIQEDPTPVGACCEDSTIACMTPIVGSTVINTTTDAGLCTTKTETDCLAGGGTYLGDYTQCGVSATPAPSQADGGGFCKPCNDECSDAIDLTSVIDAGPIFHDVRGNVDSVDAQATCDLNNSNGPNDVFYTFTAPAAGDYSIRTCDSLDYLGSLQMSIYDSCGALMPGDEILCFGDNTYGTCAADDQLPEAIISMTAGQSIIVRLAGTQNSDFRNPLVGLEVSTTAEILGSCCGGTLDCNTIGDVSQADCAANGGVWTGFQGTCADCATINPNNACVNGAPLVAPTVLNTSTSIPNFEGANGLPTAKGLCSQSGIVSDVWVALDVVRDGNYRIQTYRPGSTTSSLFWESAVYDSCDEVTRAEIACGSSAGLEFTAPFTGTVHVWLGLTSSDLSSSSGTLTDFTVFLDGFTTGACCVGTSCTLETQDDCATLGGVHQGQNVPCFTPQAEVSFLTIPVGTGAGTCNPPQSNTLDLTGAGLPLVTSVEVQVQIAGNAGFGAGASELHIWLEAPDGTIADLMKLPGRLNDGCPCDTPFAGSFADLSMVDPIIFSDAGSQSVHQYAITNGTGFPFPEAPSGNYKAAGCACRGDWNGDGVTAVGDILDFLAAWAAGVDPRADWNGDAVYAVGDILDFLSEWANGCSQIVSLNTTFAGIDPNGEWKLWIENLTQDFFPGFGGQQFQGWSLFINSGNASCP